MGKFIITQTKTGIKFSLKAGNGEVIASSQIYKEESYCRKGIASVIRNAPVAAIEDQTVEGFTVEKNPKFEIYKDKAGSSVSGSRRLTGKSSPRARAIRLWPAARTGSPQLKRTPSMRRSLWSKRCFRGSIKIEVRTSEYRVLPSRKFI